MSNGGPAVDCLGKRMLGQKLAQLWLFYKVGAVNTVFGYSLYSTLVFVGINIFLAQIASHVGGAIFNYVMYRRHVFHSAESSILKFIGAYALNYAMGLAFLALFSRMLDSPYAAGFLAMIATSLANFLVLKRFVFR